MQAAEAELFKSKGAVINVSSIATLQAADDDFVMCYTAAKAAQEKVTEVFCPVCAPPFPFYNRYPRCHSQCIRHMHFGLSLWVARLVARWWW